MKAYPPGSLELRPPFIGRGPSSCGFEGIGVRTGRPGLPTLTIERDTTTSIGYAAPPFRPPHHLFKSKLWTAREYGCSSDATSLKVGFGGNEPEPLNNLEEEEQEVECYGNLDSGTELLPQTNEDGICIQITKLGKRSLRIESSIQINASLCTIWDILTDYERLADFIPGLVVSRLLEKSGNYARLFQIGQQDLALGLKFSAKGTLDCYEKDLEILSFGQRRDIQFKMVEGDFKTFEGKWSIQQCDAEKSEGRQGTDVLEGQEFHTILCYVVEAESRLWLPVRLVEGRLCREITTILSCIRQEAQMRPPSSCL